MSSDRPSPITVTPRPSPISPKLVFGLFLIFVGVVFTLDQMGWLHRDDVLHFWPLFLIVAGLGRLFWPGIGGSRLTGLLLVIVGGWLQLEILDYIYFSIWDYWPLILVFIGARIAWRGVRGERRRESSDSASTVNAIAVMGGVSRTSNTPDFRGGDLIAVMGACEIDLRQARIIDGPAVIDALAFWGGVEVRVPEDWMVISKGIPLLGAYEDNTRPQATMESTEPPQQLLVKGFAIMGGVEVKN